MTISRGREAAVAGAETRTGIIIIGSGFGGLGMAIRLRQEGRDDFLILERAGDVGGTWRDNTYPGAACDVQSHLYSFSFALNPEWSHSFSRQPEIQAYLRRTAEEYEILPRVRFHHEVTSAEWDEAAGHWRVRAAGRDFAAPVLVMAAGALSDPMIPAIPGLDAFRGRAFHSSQWDHAYDLAGKRVAVIGTGASAIQFVPAIQPVVGRLHLFQRTPPWIIPRHDRPLGRAGQALFRRVPAAQKAVRAGIYLAREAFVFGFRNPRAMAVAQRTALRHLRRSVPDPVLRAKLTPDFTMGCKRVLLSNDYLPALTRPNVEVVTDAIAEIRARSIITRDRVEREVDAIILGTGFRPTDPPLAPVTRGREGRTLAEAWKGSPQAHLGTTVAGFPNLFILLGPNTGLGHTSVVYMIEAQLEHVIRALRHMRETGVAALEPRPEAQAAFVAEVDRRMRGTVWTHGGCASWYLDETGRNSTLWPDFTWRFRRRLSRFDPSEYRMTTMDGRMPR
ncbi:MAG TPA: NAD(P)/FAD-dependent oxidoreductase [Longimicrobium sp.]|jgi:cation diffusion facilitator CzcD-associated flavoprotein CzcO|uniref:flavin-containing monooxygenase n=1 Tax=Longimicrobium sp. TaxID=2029185 RepID=UPI002ED8D285